MSSGTVVHLRRVRAGDGEALHDVFLSSIHSLAAGHYAPDQLDAWTSEITPARLEVRLTQTIAVAAECEGRIVGFGALDVNHAELDFLYVHPDFARRGIGRRLADWVEAEALRRGIRQLQLTASLNAFAAYERMGYVRRRAMTRVLHGVAVPCVRMEKNLTPSTPP